MPPTMPKETVSENNKEEKTEKKIEPESDLVSLNAKSYTHIRRVFPTSMVQVIRYSYKTYSNRCEVVTDGSVSRNHITMSHVDGDGQ